MVNKAVNKDVNNLGTVRNTWWYRNKQQIQLQSMILPAVIFIIIFAYVPMYGLIIAFKDYKVLKGFFGSEWVGLRYFKEFFMDPIFPRLIRNTLGMNLLSFAINFPAPIIFALLLNELRFMRYKKVIQTVSYLPHFVSWVVFGGLALNILSPTTGALNGILVNIGALQEPVNFIAIPEYFWIIMALLSLIKGLGWGSIIYIAAISGVDPELYESAVVDGAGRFQRMWHITIPCIAPTISIMLIFAISGILNTGVEQLLVLQNSSNISMSETIDTYVYKIGIQQARYSFATAAGLAKSIVAVLLLLGANNLSKKISENSLF
ncbi:MAG: ABC transporter permease subunit [Caldicoprobacterales bacterium]|jgi:putative aldouronate transport system permease protein|nr:sugar ABC transporter permease [Clostridiales bacterium]